MITPQNLIKAIGISLRNIQMTAPEAVNETTSVVNLTDREKPVFGE